MAAEMVMTGSDFVMEAGEAVCELVGEEDEDEVKMKH